MGSREKYKVTAAEKMEGGRCLTFSSLWFYTIISSIIMMLTTSTWVYASSVQSTIQTVFSFSSSEIGILYSMFEVGSVFANILASYYLTNKHIPRVIAIGTSITIGSLLLYGLPHFIISYGDKIKTINNYTQHASESAAITVCVANLTNNLTVPTNASIQQEEPRDDLNELSSQSRVILAVFCIAAIFAGASYVPSYSLGIAFIDNSTPTNQKSSRFVAFFLAFYSLGQVVGFGAGSLFLAFYVNLQGTLLKPDDADWIGAWWVGYLAHAIFLVPMAIIISQFPNRFNHNKDEDSMEEKEQNERKEIEISDSLDGTNEMNQVDVKDQPESETFLTTAKQAKKSVKGLLHALKSLLTNPLYVLATVATCCQTYIEAGWMAFLPKFFEEQLKVSASMSSIYGGVLPQLISLPGVMLCGYLMDKYKLTTRQNLALISCLVSLAALCMLPMMFIGCQQNIYQDAPQNINHCVSYCGCDPNELIPVCRDGATYKSPCLVGCTSYRHHEDTIMYTGCFCEQNVTLTKGACADSLCFSKYIMVTLAVLSTCFEMASFAPAMCVVMKLVRPEEKSLAIGLQAAISSPLAYIPAPILYGYVIDWTCRMWELPDGTPENPGWKGYCLEYNNTEYRYRIVGISFTALALSSLLLLLVWRMSYLPRYNYIDSTASTNDDEKETES